MNLPRETIYAKLFSLLQTAYAWKSTSRRLRLWTDVDPSDQPAMFLRQLSEPADQHAGSGLTRWLLKSQVWIYMQAAPNADEIGNWPSQAFNPVVDAVDRVLAAPIPGEGQNLSSVNGGVPVVENVWIDGPILEDDPVAPDQQIVIVIPLTLSTGV